MIDIVDETLTEWRQTCFAWGARDCMLSIGDYIARRGGVDIAAQYKGLYATEAEALAHMEAAGGACALVAATGWQETDTPRRGDVIVINVAGDGIGGLCLGDRAAFRLERGVVEVHLKFLQIVKAWQCPL